MRKGAGRKPKVVHTTSPNLQRVQKAATNVVSTAAPAPGQNDLPRIPPLNSGCSAHKQPHVHHAGEIMPVPTREPYDPAQYPQWLAWRAQRDEEIAAEYMA